MHSRLSAFSFAFACLFFAVAVTAAPEGPVIGKVTLMLGTVTGVDQDGDAFEVKRGTELHAGYTLETAARSFVRAEMNDGTRMTLSQNGSATLDEFSFNQAANSGGFKTTIRRGGFKYKSGRLANLPTRVHSRIATPSGVIGVRGTEIEAVLESDGKLTINIPVGNIDITFTRPDGSTYTQSIGINEPVQIVQVSRDGTFEGLEQIPPNLRNAITVLAEQVDEAVQAQESEQQGSTNQNNDDEGDNEEGDNNDEGDNEPSDPADPNNTPGQNNNTPDQTPPDDTTPPQAQNLTFETDTQTLTPTPSPGGGATPDIIEEAASPSTR